MFRVPTISLGSQLTKSAWSTALLKILQTRVTQRPGCRASVAHDHMQTPLDATVNHHSRAEQVAASLPKDQALAILREIDETERMMWAEMVLWPEAGMVIHHTRLERAHVGLVDEGSRNKPELESRVAVIAKRSGYRTVFAYATSPTQALIQGMDYDKIGCMHSVERWAGQTCREQQEKIADWRRIKELSNSVDLTQKGGNQFKEARGAAGMNADELVLVELNTGIFPAGITAELLGLSPGAHWPKCSYCWRRTLLFGTCEECVGEPCLRYCCRTFDGRRLCPEHWPRRPDSQGQLQQIWPSVLNSVQDQCRRMPSTPPSSTAPNRLHLISIADRQVTRPDACTVVAMSPPGAEDMRRVIW